MKRQRAHGWMAKLLWGGVAVCVVRLLFPGESEAQRLKAKLAARGERFTLEALGFGQATNEDRAWSVLEEAAQRFGDMSGAEVDPARGVDIERIRSKPPQVAWGQPFLYSYRSGTVLEWNRATAIANRVQPELASLHEAMGSPTARAAWESRLNLYAPIPNYRPLRETAQGLHEFVQVDLRRGAIDPAFTNLMTMVRLCRYHQETAQLVVYMLRVAITGLTVDALWQALQAPGWSEAQLEALQRELAAIDILKTLPLTLELERVGRLQELDKYREGGTAHLQDLARNFGLATMQSGFWKQRLHHAHWSLFRYRDVELRVIQELQQQIDRTRQLAEGHALNTLPAEPTPWQRTPLNAWFDKWAEPNRGFPLLSMYDGVFNSTRAVRTVASNETARRLALVALALERFRLATGGLPETLEQLVPDYLAGVPVDLLEGRSIRYKVRPDQHFSLYAQDATGEPQGSSSEPLTWPAAEPPLPYPEALKEEAQNDDVLPLVQFEGAPLLDVIQTLARQADINLIVDTRVLEYDYPPVDFRLENVTARQTLDVLLRNYGLRLETDPRTMISRVTLPRPSQRE